MSQEQNARAMYERSREAALDARSDELKRIFRALFRWLAGTTVREELIRPSRPSIAFSI
jgi:hypothetical protein